MVNDDRGGSLPPCPGFAHGMSRPPRSAAQKQRVWEQCVCPVHEMGDCQTLSSIWRLSGMNGLGITLWWQVPCRREGGMERGRAAKSRCARMMQVSCIITHWRYPAPVCPWTCSSFDIGQLAHTPTSDASLSPPVGVFFRAAPNNTANPGGVDAERADVNDGCRHPPACGRRPR